MADRKRVLVVDDHFEMLDFLRSMLELSSQNYDVLAVPSAEEGLLELRQEDFDLLITDVRLAGMSGFDLVRRLQTFKPAIPVIMITAYSSAQGEREAAELGVHRYFRKPLDTDEVLAAVHTALYGGLVVHADRPDETEPSKLAMPEDVARRLGALRSDTGAAKIALATISGQLLLQVGQGQGLNLPKLTALIASNLDNSFLLAEELGGNNPTTIQYHSGNRIELYIANVGRDYFLAILFDVQSRRGRMGTIWVFAQRAIKDLLKLLPRVEESDSVLTSEEVVNASGSPATTTAPPRPALSTDQASSGETSEAAAPTRVESGKEDGEEGDDGKEIDVVGQLELMAPTESDGYITPGTGELIGGPELDAFWDAGILKSERDMSGTMSFEEAQRQGFIPDASEPDAEADTETVNALQETNPAETVEFLELDENVQESSVPLDDFWEAAADEESAASGGGPDGLSLEQALQQGLIPKSFRVIPNAESRVPGEAKEVANPELGDDLPLRQASASTEIENPAALEGIEKVDSNNIDETVDLDAFWDSAVDAEEAVGDDLTNGFSYEEAVRRGIIKTENETDETAD